MTSVRAGAPALMMDSKVLRTRERLPAELALEHFLERPFAELLREAEETGQCDENDLMAMGWAVFRGLLALARGEVAAISLEKRLPRHREFGLATA